MLKRLLRLIGAAAAHETEESAKSRAEGPERALPPLAMFVIADRSRSLICTVVITRT